MIDQKSPLMSLKKYSNEMNLNGTGMKWDFSLFGYFNEGVRLVFQLIFVDLLKKLINVVFIIFNTLYSTKNALNCRRKISNIQRM